ncbi:hypothetical protein ACF09Y_06190 [Streptomyces massasporeus]|uniref:hypothetical protein n=1 Tax=Streptomyces massasporeus TaxID=67324 RepID=UPI0036FDF0C7
MPPRAGGLYGSRAGPGRTRAEPDRTLTGPCRTHATDEGSRTTDGSARAVDGSARTVATGVRVPGSARAGVVGAWAAGIPVASTPSSALRLHVPAPAP